MEGLYVRVIIKGENHDFNFSLHDDFGQIKEALDKVKIN